MINSSIFSRSELGILIDDACFIYKIDNYFCNKSYLFIYSVINKEIQITNNNAYKYVIEKIIEIRNKKKYNKKIDHRKKHY